MFIFVIHSFIKRERRKAIPGVSIHDEYKVCGKELECITVDLKIMNVK